ncbi:extensin family protein [Labrenzia sp. OB1]|uniref:extensin-like domain-containing protein n=1 Tax=Labrenzia sp. OB1 TaxID=1561204 RepID=UPI0008387ABA|nr:extensin family protein [Labrenzia sp. OB1]
MRLVSKLRCVVLAGTFFGLPALAVGEAVPEAKPLATMQQEPFLEGVDTPPTKPQAPDSPGKTPGVRSKALAACVIPGALLDVAEPVAGGRHDGCGIADPVRLSGVVRGGDVAKFSAPVTVSCEFAKVLTGWLRQDVLPEAERAFDSPVAVVASGPGYQCRRRNNRPDGKLSEHALGMAIDIAQFQLADRSDVSVEKDWGAKTEKGRFLKAIHAKACKRFTTVLGPDADPDHRSHFHLDTGCHGQDCTYIICQ